MTSDIWINIGSGNCLLPVRYKAVICFFFFFVIWTNTDSLTIGPHGVPSEIYSKRQDTYMCFHSKNALEYGLCKIMHILFRLKHVVCERDNAVTSCYHEAINFMYESVYSLLSRVPHRSSFSDYFLCSATHAVFGDIKKLLTKEFVHQRYLEYTLQPATEPPIHEFRWGQRAFAETTKRNVLDFVSQVGHY